MPEAYSYAQSEIIVPYDLTNFTFEFWLKKTSGYSRDSTFITIHERGNNRKQLLSIK